MANITLEKINKTNGQRINQDDIAKIDNNATKIEDTINSLPTSSGSTVTTSTTNGNILIDGVETNVYTHPSGTNPHGTTKNDVGLGNVDNTSDLNKPISTASQSALDGKANTVHTHNLNYLSEKSYNSLTDKPTIPTIIALTASEYTAIVTPNANTLYLIKA